MAAFRSMLSTPTPAGNGLKRRLPAKTSAVIFTPLGKCVGFQQPLAEILAFEARATSTSMSPADSTSRVLRDRSSKTMTWHLIQPRL